MNKINQFDKGDVTIESTEEVFSEGFFKIDKYRFKHALFAGGTSATILSVKYLNAVMLWPCCLMIQQRVRCYSLSKFA